MLNTKILHNKEILNRNVQNFLNIFLKLLPVHGLSDTPYDSHMIAYLLVELLF